MRTALWIWTRARRTLGAPGLAALALLVPAALLLSWLPQLRLESSQAESSLVAETLSARRKGPPSARPLSSADQTRQYIAEFPPMTQSASDLESVFKAAQQHHITLAKGEYQVKSDPNGAFVRYTATFPLHDDFGSVKDFSADVLTALPHAAMDELRMARDSAGGTALDAVVRFTFFYRSL